MMPRRSQTSVLGAAMKQSFEEYSNLICNSELQYKLHLEAQVYILTAINRNNK